MNMSAVIDTPKDISNVMTEKFLRLFPNIPMVIATVISFIIVFLLLTYLVYKPLKRMMKQRHDFIQSNIDSSIKSKSDAILLSNQASDKLKEAHKQADVVINKAKIDAENVVISYTSKAKIDSKHLLEETARDIESQKKEFEKESKQKIVETAILLAKKIIQKDITEQDQKDVIEVFLKSDLNKKDA